MPPDAARHGRPRLPERLGDGQPEALADRLLEHRRRVHLERVDLDRADVVQVREDEDVGVAGRVGDGLVVVVPALGIVVRHRADERELHVRDALLARAGRRRSRRAGPSTGRSARPASAAAARRRSRTGRRCTRRPRPRAPCSSAPAGRSPAARCTPGGSALGLRDVLAACGRSPRRSARATAAGTRAPPRFGVERSMWQRQIQCAARVREVVDHRRRLRVVDDDEVVVVLELLRRSARCSGGRSPAAPCVSPCGSPWSALWIVFVTLKNSSAPRMIRHSTSSPASCISGTSV